MASRQIVLDTETTGLDPAQGHRIIEIGCVELLNRRLTSNRFHYYLQPDREIDAGASAVHGITNTFLADKPRFPDIAQELLSFVADAELIIHNAAFDLGFLDHELRRCDPQWASLEDFCRGALDTLHLARRLHPGQRNTLDALCKRYSIDNTQRTLHGALLDAELLADVYLAMTGGQVALILETETRPVEQGPVQTGVRDKPDQPLPVRRANAEEQAAHQRYLELLEKSSGGQCLWKRLEEPNE